MDTASFPTGVYSRKQLERLGVRGRAFAALVAAGRLQRVRTGYYSCGPVDERILAAVRAGGVATGTTALGQYGIWVPPGREDDVEIAVGSNAHPPRTDGVTVHWTAEYAAEPPTGARFTPVAPVRMAIEHALEGLPPDQAAAVLDSAVFTRRINRSDARRIVAQLPRESRAALRGRLNGRAESGIETLVRYLLEEHGFVPDIQVLIAGVGRVDLLIDGWLIIECDGSEHADPKVARNDRRRDAAAARQGYRTLRFGYDMIVYDLPTVLATVVAVFAEGAPRLRAFA